MAKAGFLRLFQCLFGGAQCQRGLPADVLGDLLCAFQRQGIDAHFTDQPALQCARGVNGFATQHHLTGEGLADAANQALSAAGPWHQAEGDFRQAKTGAFAANDNVAGQRQLAAGAERIAVHCRQQRFTELRQPLPQQRAAIRQRSGQVLPLQFVQIGTGGKETRCAGDHYCANGGIGIGLFQ
ncbi:hypothetical protein D3C72_1671160 [compost metagenome]